MSYNNVERKLELAIKSVITRKYDTIPGHVGHANDSVALPHYTIHSPSSKEGIYDTGTLIVEVEVKVKSDADTSSTDGSPSDHYEREGAIFDAILTSPQSDFVGDLNTSGVEEFTAFRCKEVGRMSGIEGRAFVSTLRLQVICCGSIIS